MKSKTMKGTSVDQMGSYGWAFVVFGILLAIASVVLYQFHSNTYVTASSNATTIVEAGQVALNDLSNWLPIIVIIVAATVIIALLFSGFGRKGSKMV